jgi:hypothetical protein
MKHRDRPARPCAAPPEGKSKPGVPIAKRAAVTLVSVSAFEHWPCCWGFRRANAWCIRTIPTPRRGPGAYELPNDRISYGMIADGPGPDRQAF